MSEARDRYAVRFADGTYSRGGTCRVEVDSLDKAKLWRTRGHVTNHLNQFHSEDLEGARVVSVRLMETGESYDAAAYVREKEARDALRRDKQEAERAARDLERAESALADAKARLAQRRA